MQMKQWLYVVFLTLVFSACSDNNVKKYVIGVSQCSEDIWRDKLNNELVMSTYQHDNVTLNLLQLMIMTGYRNNRLNSL